MARQWQVTKRKLNKAMALAVDDRKIPDANGTFVMYYGEAALHWPQGYSTPLIAMIRARSDNTLFVSYAEPVCHGAPVLAVDPS